MFKETSGRYVKLAVNSKNICPTCFSQNGYDSSATLKFPEITFTETGDFHGGD
jgi:hypothetical protein